MTYKLDYIYYLIEWFRKIEGFKRKTFSKVLEKISSKEMPCLANEHTYYL